MPGEKKKIEGSPKPNGPRNAGLFNFISSLFKTLSLDRKNPLTKERLPETNKEALEMMWTDELDFSDPTITQGYLKAYGEMYKKLRKEENIPHDIRSKYKATDSIINRSEYIEKPDQRTVRFENALDDIDPKAGLGEFRGKVNDRISGGIIVNLFASDTALRPNHNNPNSGNKLLFEHDTTRNKAANMIFVDRYNPHYRLSADGSNQIHNDNKDKYTVRCDSLAFLFTLPDSSVDAVSISGVDMFIVGTKDVDLDTHYFSLMNKEIKRVLKPGGIGYGISFEKKYRDICFEGMEDMKPSVEYRKLYLYQKVAQ